MMHRDTLQQRWGRWVKKLSDSRQYRNDNRLRHQHVYPVEQGWAVHGQGNEWATAVYPGRAEAIARAKRIASRNGSSVIVHKRQLNEQDEARIQEVPD